MLPCFRQGRIKKVTPTGAHTGWQVRRLGLTGDTLGRLWPPRSFGRRMEIGNRCHIPSASICAATRGKVPVR